MEFDPLKSLHKLNQNGQVKRTTIERLLGTTNNQISQLKKQAKATHTFNTPAQNIPEQIKTLGSARLILKRMLGKMPRLMFYAAGTIAMVGAIRIMIDHIKTQKSDKTPFA